MKNLGTNHYGPLFNPDAEPEQIAPSSFDFDFSIAESESENSPCMSRLVCTGCGRKYGCCNEIEQILLTKEKETEQMITRSSSSSSSSKPSSSGNTGRGIPFLNVTELNSERKSATIIAAKVQPDNFKKNENVVVVKLQFGGSQRLWTLRSNNPNLDVLCDSLGEDESRWKDVAINLFTETDTFDGKVWMRVEVVTGKGGRK